MKASTSKGGNLGYSVGANYFGVFGYAELHGHRIRLPVSGLKLVGLFVCALLFRWVNPTKQEADTMQYYNCCYNCVPEPAVAMRAPFTADFSSNPTARRHKEVKAEQKSVRGGGLSCP